MESSPSNLQQPEIKTAEPHEQNDVVTKVIAVTLIIWVAFLISKIVLQSTEIGTPASSSEAMIAANERLLQMAQWTITTVLTLGGALIGLNWYQSEKRNEHDRRVFEERITAELELRLQNLKTQLDMVTQASIWSLDAEAARFVRDAVGNKDGTAYDLTFTNRVITFYSPTSTTRVRRGVGRVLIEEIMASGSAAPGLPGKLTSEQMNQIKKIADDLMRDSIDMAQELMNSAKSYELWHFYSNGSSEPSDGQQQG